MSHGQSVLCALAAAHDCVAASEYGICRAANRYRDAYPAVCCKGADLAWLGIDCFTHSIRDDDMLLANLLALLYIQPNATEKCLSKYQLPASCDVGSLFVVSSRCFVFSPALLQLQLRCVEVKGREIRPLGGS
ncbi:hypothetical protein J3F84DRAFT_358291 [Trichoderma pleuroticola]